MCLSIDVPTDKSYTFVIPVPSFRAPDAIHSDIKVFNFIEILFILKPESTVGL